MKTKEQLPGFILADLYSKSLVFINDEIKDKNAKKEVQSTQKLYTGNYEKKIIVLINEAGDIYKSDGTITFLSGILKACRINIQQIALIHFNNNAVDFIKLKKEMKPEFLLLFGVTALQVELPFDMPHYQVQLYDNCQIITAPALIELNTENTVAIAEKKKLWKSLQKMFNLEK